MGGHVAGLEEEDDIDAGETEERAGEWRGFVVACCTGAVVSVAGDKTCLGHCIRYGGAARQTVNRVVSIEA